MISSDPNPTAEPGFLKPRVLIPFVLVSLIWGSTWLVIKDQLSTVPASWSVTYRFVVACAGMFILGKIMRVNMQPKADVMRWTIVLGLMQFAINFNFVYQAEHHITSGLVAVIFALLMIPNAVLGKWWLGREISRSFILGSLIATLGVVLLMIQEYRVAPVGGVAVMIGAGLTLVAIMSASVSNVLQVMPHIARFPTIMILAWSMLWGAIFNASWSWIMHGSPVIDPRPAYIGGVFYLAIVGSVVTFPLYFRLIRDIGPGKAAYTGVLIPVVAMLLSTIFEGFRWSATASAGALLATTGLLVAMQKR
jgi:drug/metabolite transporter (DMT)-like permease